MLSVEGLTKEFESVVAVDDVDLELRSGEIHGLIGPNGAGKTTTVNLITGELTPTAGSIQFEGEELIGESPSSIARRGIGRSFQVVQFFPEMTVRKHLKLAVRDSTETVRSVARRETDYTPQIREVAERVNLESDLDTVARSLPHGKKRFLDIGMVLAMDSKVILFDEPAAGLNPSETDEVEEILESLRGEYTVLIVEHDVELVRSISDRITVLHNGSVLTTDTPENVVENPQVKEVYLGE